MSKEIEKYKNKNYEIVFSRMVVEKNQKSVMKITKKVWKKKQKFNIEYYL